jgi:hypothetical protein
MLLALLSDVKRGGFVISSPQNTNKALIFNYNIFGLVFAIYIR